MKKTKKKPKSKKSNLPKFLLGAAVLGGVGYAAYEFWYKPMQTKKTAADAAASAQQAAASAGATVAAPAIQNAIQQVQAVQTNTIPASSLSPIGTANNKINWAAKVKYGDKGGEVQVIQKLFNNIARLAGSPTISVDGVYGPQTLAKKRLNFGDAYTVTPKQVYDLFQKRKENSIVEVNMQSTFDTFENIFN